MLKNGFYDFIYYFIKIWLFYHAKFTHYIFLSITSNNLTLHKTGLVKITSTHAIIKLVTILRIDVWF